MSEALARDSGLKLSVLLAYALFVIAPANGLTAIAGIILVTLKRDEARGTVWEGHLRNLTWVFWAAAAVTVIGVVAIVLGAGGFLVEMTHTDGNPPADYLIGLVSKAIAAHVALVLFAVWYLYRTIRGLVRGLESKPY